MAFVEDFAPFLADFGVDATLDGQAVRVIFDRAFDVAAMAARGLATDAPQVMLPTAGVPASPHGKVIDIPGAGRFVVVDNQPDGTGMSVLVLERAP